MIASVTGKTMNQFLITPASTKPMKENPVTVKNGMIRSVAKDAELARLEAPFTLWQKTTLKTLSLNLKKSNLFTKTVMKRR